MIGESARSERFADEALRTIWQVDAEGTSYLKVETDATRGGGLVDILTDAQRAPTKRFVDCAAVGRHCRRRIHFLHTVLLGLPSEGGFVNWRECAPLR